MERDNHKRNKIKTAVFWALLFLPLFILLWWGILFSKDVLQLKRITHQQIAHNLSKYFKNIEAGGTWPWKIPAGSIDGLRALKESVSPIYVFGASSVVLSGGRTFSEFLEDNLRRINPHIRVYNFGRSKLSSFEVKQRVFDVVDNGKINPKLIVLYLGHNDYNNAYRSIYSSYKGFEPFLRISYFLCKIFRGHEYIPKYGVGRHIKINRPRIFNMLQKMGLMEACDRNSADINEMILKKFKQNIGEILNFVEERGIPVVIITPVGNLQAEPYGNIKKAAHWYKKGIRARGYRESIGYLIKAKDEEMFTMSIRAKSDLNNYIRTLKGEDVYVFDLEKKFINEGFRFGTSDFSDYFHFKEKTHKIIADHLSEFIKYRINIGQFES